MSASAAYACVGNSVRLQRNSPAAVRLIIVSISGLAAACRRVWRSGSTPDSARVFWSAISRMRTSAFSAAQSAVGETQSSCASLACLKNGGAWPSIISSTIGKAAGLHDLLVHRERQRLGRDLALDHADVALLHRGGVVHEDAGEGLGALVPHASLLRAWRAVLPRHGQEQRMQAQVVGQLGMERGHEHVALARHDRVAVDLGQHLDPVPGVLDPRRADEHRAQRLVAEALHVHVLLEAADLAPEGVAARLDVHQAEVGAIEHDQPGAGAEHGPSAAPRSPGWAARGRRPRSRCSSSCSPRRG